MTYNFITLYHIYWWIILEALRLSWSINRYNAIREEMLCNDVVWGTRRYCSTHFIASILDGPVVSFILRLFYPKRKSLIPGPVRTVWCKTLNLSQWR